MREKNSDGYLDVLRDYMKMEEIKLVDIVISASEISYRLIIEGDKNTFDWKHNQRIRNMYRYNSFKTYDEIMSTMHLSRSSVYRHLDDAKMIIDSLEV